MITKTYVGKNDDGSPHYRYESDGPVVFTGPHIFGTVAVADGTTYDVSEPVIEAPVEHHGEISHAIGVRHEAEGHPLHADPDQPFVHTCTDHCGALNRETI